MILFTVSNFSISRILDLTSVNVCSEGEWLFLALEQAVRNEMCNLLRTLGSTQTSAHFAWSCLCGRRENHLVFFFGTSVIVCRAGSKLWKTLQNAPKYNSFSLETGIIASSKI